MCKTLAMATWDSQGERRQSQAYPTGLGEAGSSGLQEKHKPGARQTHCHSLNLKYTVYTKLASNSCSPFLPLPPQC